MGKPGAFWPPFKKPLACAGCPLETKGRSFVPGFGDIHNARMVIIMERPGENECTEGRPAVGKSGYHVNKGLGGGRDGVFLTNIRKCLAENETPDEKGKSIVHCVGAYLNPELGQIEALNKDAGNPKGILLVGGDATSCVLGRRDVTALHGSIWTKKEADAIAASSDAPEHEPEPEPE